MFRSGICISELGEPANLPVITVPAVWTLVVYNLRPQIQIGVHSIEHELGVP